MTVTNPTEAILKTLPIGSIVESTTNPRRHFDAASMLDLGASICEIGIQVPLLVRPVRGAEEHEYELVAGARRLRAAQNLMLPEVPCLVRDMTDDEAREIQIVENLQRADVHPVEEAEAYAGLVEQARTWRQVDYGGHVSIPERVGVDLTAEDIAKRVGKSTAYVAQRLKLLELTAESKGLYGAGHITLGHALLLARLTPADQERGLCFMLDIDRKYVKRAIAEIVGNLLARSAPKVTPTPGFCRFCGCTEAKACEGGCAWIDAEMTACSADACAEQWEDLQMYSEMDDETTPSTARIQKYMHEGKRKVEATEAQLKRWIESSVLLKLADVPWRLDDADLVPFAGACVNCPKRSGSNAALFSDFTAAEDVCLDTACFASKQDATLKRHKQAARVTGAKALLKISEKSSREKLEEPAVRRLPLTTPSGGPGNSGAVVGETVTVTKKTVRKGQWAFAEAESCKDVIQGLMVDGDDKGKLFLVCANQGCKVHKHEVDSPRSNGGGHSNAQYEEDQRKAREKAAAYVVAEIPVRKAIHAAIKVKVKLDAESVIRRALSGGLQEWGSPAICELAGIELAGGEDWAVRREAKKLVLAAIAKRKGAELLALAFDIFHADAFNVSANMHAARKKDREDTWKLAATYGVDADAIAQTFELKVEKKAPATKPSKKATAKKPAKKVAAKPAKKVAAKKKGAAK